MFSNLRSLIFKLDPETAHSLAIKSLKFNFVPNILDEDKNNPLNDDILVLELAKQNYNLARRTVAKYRDQMGFPVARLRKEV